MFSFIACLFSFIFPWINVFSEFYSLELISSQLTKIIFSVVRNPIFISNTYNYPQFESSFLSLLDIYFKLSLRHLKLKGNILLIFTHWCDLTTLKFFKCTMKASLNLTGYNFNGCAFFHRIIMMAQVLPLFQMSKALRTRSMPPSSAYLQWRGLPLSLVKLMCEGKNCYF